MTPRFAFDNSFARLPGGLPGGFSGGFSGGFHARLAPTPVAEPRLIRLNRPLAELLGLDPEALASPEGVAILAGNAVPEGAEPLAMAYAGHQFGGFVPQLGDGRAILLGEVVGRDGLRRDIQLKGSGPTPFSRRGDGRAALGPVLREYLVSEAMAALGVPTTRALAAVSTGEAVLRETPLPGAVLTRVASSHLRVGSFQFFAARGDVAALRQLTDYAIARHDPEAAGAPRPARALLDGVVARQAALVARWLLLGFIHGVMNTDNTSISGETIDYGPCAFLDAYEPGKVFSSIDLGGRYAYGNQPRAMHWNLARLAEALLPLLEEEEEAAIASAQEALAGFGPAFEAAYLAGLRRKTGLLSARQDDAETMQALLDLMAAQQADFTLAFRALADTAAGAGNEEAFLTLFAEREPAAAWLSRWRSRLEQEPGSPASRAGGLRAANPAFIPRNHRVEAALGAAIWQRDLGRFETLLGVLSRPFEDQPEHRALMLPPQPEERVERTFCGT